MFVLNEDNERAHQTTSEMANVTAIARNARLPSAVLTAAYLLLVVMLAFHHHAHSTAAAGPHGAIAAEAAEHPGQHSASECPVIQHAQHAFLAVPALQVHAAALPVSHSPAIRSAPGTRGALDAACAVRGPPQYS